MILLIDTEYFIVAFVDICSLDVLYIVYECI